MRTHAFSERLLWDRTAVAPRHFGEMLVDVAVRSPRNEKGCGLRSHTRLRVKALCLRTVCTQVKTRSCFFRLRAGGGEIWEAVCYGRIFPFLRSQCMNALHVPLRESCNELVLPSVE